MSNEKLARQWAERKKAQAKRHMEDAGYVTREDTLAAIEHVLATTDPLTMADAVWNDEKHHLAGATTPSGIEVVMLWLNTGINRIVTGGGLYARDMLTPNGKRYELREVGAPEQPEHPEVLTTREDYENAPVGTIVARNEYHPCVKQHFGVWENTFGTTYSDAEMADASRQVLRWGWGK